MPSVCLLFRRSFEEDLFFFFFLLECSFVFCTWVGISRSFTFGSTCPFSEAPTFNTNLIGGSSGLSEKLKNVCAKYPKILCDLGKGVYTP